MKIFVSWSGDQTKPIAELLRTWLPKVLVGRVEVFVSSKDIEKGERGLAVIAENLAETDRGLIVLAKSNKDSTWVHFEAGALSKALDTARVIPLLLDLTTTDVEGPLAQFQSTVLGNRGDVWKLLSEIALGIEGGVPESSLSALFEKFWPELENAVKESLRSETPIRSTRSSQDILEEVLEIVRGLARELPSGFYPDIAGIDRTLPPATIASLTDLRRNELAHRRGIDPKHWDPITDDVEMQLEVMRRKVEQLREFEEARRQAPQKSTRSGPPHLTGQASPRKLT